MEIYTRREISENLFEIIGPHGEAIRNHNDKKYTFLSENISRNLIGDLNSILEKYLKKELTQTSESILNNILAGLSGVELRESFCYCLLSSLMEYEEQQMDAQLDIETQIQRDRLFRLNTLENGGNLELNATKKARAFFKDKWKNFGLNNSQSFDEMEADYDEIVSEEIVIQISEIAEKMHISKKVAVEILSNFFDYFSITIPILWVNGIINDEDFISGYYALNYGTSLNDLDEEAYEEPQFLMNRLLYLKTIIWGYQWKDQTLPCFHYE
jgi:hypothetical protein